MVADVQGTTQEEDDKGDQGFQKKTRSLLSQVVVFKGLFKKKENNTFFSRNKKFDVLLSLSSEQETI